MAVQSYQYTNVYRPSGYLHVAVSYTFVRSDDSRPSWQFTTRRDDNPFIAVEFGQDDDVMGYHSKDFKFDTKPGLAVTHVSFHASYHSQKVDYGWTLFDAALEQGSQDIDGTAGLDIAAGGAAADVIHTFAGNDLLDGGGGTDRLYGGSGDDTYYVSGHDRVVEYKGEGRDSVTASGSYTLAAGQEIESLRAEYAQASVKLYGNEFAQYVDGSRGNDRLDGRGGDDHVTDYDGNNQLYGGTGNDVLYSGKGNDRLSGDIGNDFLYAGTGTNILSGGAGHDIFLFGGPIGAGNLSHITDFRAADDTIELAKYKTGFARVSGTTTLSPTQFKDITDPQTKLDGNDHILYNHDTGRLYYDADGSGHAAKVQFAMLDTHPTLTYADFHVFIT